MDGVGSGHKSHHKAAGKKSVSTQSLSAEDRIEQLGKEIDDSIHLFEENADRIEQLEKELAEMDQSGPHERELLEKQNMLTQYRDENQKIMSKLDDFPKQLMSTLNDLPPEVEGNPRENDNIL